MNYYIKINLSSILLIFILTFGLVAHSIAQIRQTFESYGIEEVKPLFDYEELADGGKSILEPDSDYKRQVGRAVEALDSRDVDLAMKIADSIIISYAHLPVGYYLKAKSIGRHIDSARYYFKQLLTFDSFELKGLAHLEIGYTYMSRYEISKEGFGHFNLARKFIPDSPGPLYALAYAEYVADRYNKSIEYAKLAIERDSTFLPAYYIMLNIWSQRLNHDMAHEITLRMLDIEPDNEKVQLYKALLYFQTGDDDFALQLLDHVIRENPKSLDGVSLKGWYFYRESRNMEGFELVIKYIRLSIEKIEDKEAVYASSLDRQLMHALTYIANEMHTYDQKLRDYLFAIVRNMLYDEDDEARRKLTKIESKFGGNPTGMLMLRAALFEAAEDSFYWLQDNITITERDSTLHHHFKSLGDYYFYYERFEKAEVSYTRSVNLNSKLIHGIKMRGLTRLELKKYKKAVQDLNIYLNDNFDLKIYESRAMCYKNLGYIELAAKDLQIAFESRKDEFYFDPFLDLFTIKLMLKDTTAALVLADSALSKADRAYEYEGEIMKGELYNLKGLVYMSLKEFELAEQEFTNAINSDPYFDLPYINRGKLSYDNDNYEQAFKDFDEFVKLTTSKGIGYLWRGKSSLMLQKKSAALRDFKLADKNGIAEAIEWYYRVNY